MLGEILFRYRLFLYVIFEKYIQEKLRTFIVKDVSVTDEELNTAYASSLEENSDNAKITKEAFYQTLLKTKQDEAYNSMIENWLENANIQENLNALDQ